MNLWAKRAGQLLVVAVLFFFISCEDDSLLLGFKGNSKFKGRIQEFTFTGDASSSFLIDSLNTHNAFSSPQRFLLGQYLDPAFGTVSSTVYTQFQPTVTVKLDNSAILMSTKLQLLFDFYYYGPSSQDNLSETYTIHRITGDSISHSLWYYSNSTFTYDPTPLAEFTFSMTYFDFEYHRNRARDNERDSLSFANIELDAGFGTELFNYITSNDSLLKEVNNQVFRNQFKGLAIVPKSDNKLILGFNPADVTLSNIIMRYRTSTDTLQRVFSFAPSSGTVSFNNIKTLRTNELAGAQPNQKVSPAGGNRYIQNGSPVISHIDIKSFYDFIRGKDTNNPEKDSLEQIIINSGEFSIGVETPPAGMPPPSTLVMRMLKKTSETELRYVDYLVDTDSSKMIKQRIVLDAGRYFNIADEATSATNPLSATLTYNESRKAYIGNASLFFQNIFDRKNEENIDQYYIALLPVNPTMGKSVNRVVLKSDQMKLRIHYIKPTN